jgi:hypothetical protein
MNHCGNTSICGQLLFWLEVLTRLAGCVYDIKDWLSLAFKVECPAPVAKIDVMRNPVMGAPFTAGETIGT